MEQAIRAGNWAPGALREVIGLHTRRIETLESEYMRERADDIKNLAQRVLGYLQKSERASPLYAEQSILIGDMLTPADLAEVPEGCLAGIICARGSSNSHVAILARAMKVPTVMGVGEAPIFELQDEEIILDGYYGQVYVAPSQALRQEFDRLLEEEKKLDATQPARNTP